eukprot:TRINITY_DN5289_c1_g1_i1.p1 TRINITY_DN5289_c1_g1~~TRINITY_DN5289_c1_g1_i1.p1  ORF type:complete len:1317 (+),score=268.98 TRINITY_DN5289_c1_g1_i1:90-4040(+)
MDGGRHFLTSTLLELEAEAKRLFKTLHSEGEEGVYDDTEDLSEVLQWKSGGDMDVGGLVCISTAKLDLGPIRQLKKLFQQKWSSAAIAVGMPEKIFTERIAPILLPGAQPSLYPTMTSRIDTDANGVIDWEEFSSYLLMNQQQAGEAMDGFDKQYTYKPAAKQKSSQSAHKEPIHKIICTADKYFTASLDGTVKVWNSSNQSYMTTMHNDGAVAKSRYISDLAYLNVSNRIGVFQIDRTVTLYDAATTAIHKMYRGVEPGSKYCSERYREVHDGEGMLMLAEGGPPASDDDWMKLQAKDQNPVQQKMFPHIGRNRLTTEPKRIEVLPMDGLQYSPMCAEVVTSSMQKRLFPHLSEPVLLGLEQGWVQLYNFRRESGRESDLSLRVQQQWRPHTSWVTKIKVCDRLDSLITLSMDQYLKVYNLEKSEEIQSLGGPNGACPTFGQKDAGILGFDYNEDVNIIATWGASTVLLWNPTMTNPTKLAQKTPVVSVKFNPDSGHALVLTEDKTLSVYDVRSSKCVQQIVDKVLRRPENKLSALEYDSKKGCIVAAANMPVAFQNQHSGGRLQNGRDKSRGSDGQGHQKPIIAALFNSCYNHVVSADSHKVYVWDFATGNKVASWAPGGRITSLAFDTGQRRLLVSMPGGVLSVWNYINGEQLKKCSNTNTFELACLCHAEVVASASDGNAFIIAAGWSGKILLWIDAAGEFFVPLRQELHIGNNWGHVYSMSFNAPNRLALGTSSGAVVMYDLGQMTVYTVLKATPNAQRMSEVMHRQSAVSLERAEFEFSKFQTKMQEGLSHIVEQIVFAGNSSLLSLHGNGLVVVWRCGKSDTSEIVSAFHATHSPTEEAFVISVAPEKGLVFIGDSGGVVSVFDAAIALATKTLQTKQPRSASINLESTASNVFSFTVTHKTRKPSQKQQPTHQGTLENALRLAMTTQNVTVKACFKPHNAVLSSVIWVPGSEVLVTAAGDKEIKVSTSEGVPLAVVGAAGWPLNPSKINDEEAPGDPEITPEGHQWTRRVVDISPALGIKTVPTAQSPVIRRSMSPVRELVSRDEKEMTPTAERECSFDTKLKFTSKSYAPTVQMPQTQVKGIQLYEGSPKAPQPPTDRMLSASPAMSRGRPNTARALHTNAGINDALQEMRTKPRAEVTEVLVAQEKQVVTEEVEESPRGREDVDLDQVRKTFTVSWAHGNDFVPNGLSKKRPPLFSGYKAQPPLSDTGKGLNPRNEGAKSGPRFFSQFKPVIEHKPDQKVVELMAASQSMQVVRMAKQEGKQLSSYSALHTAPVKTVNPAKPYTDTTRSKRGKHGKDIAAELYLRC